MASNESVDGQITDDPSMSRRLRKILEKWRKQNANNKLKASSSYTYNPNLRVLLTKYSSYNFKQAGKLINVLWTIFCRKDPWLFRTKLRWKHRNQHDKYHQHQHEDQHDPWFEDGEHEDDHDQSSTYTSATLLLRARCLLEPAKLTHTSKRLQLVKVSPRLFLVRRNTLKMKEPVDGKAWSSCGSHAMGPWTGVHNSLEWHYCSIRMPISSRERTTASFAVFERERLSLGQWYL